MSSVRCRSCHREERVGDDGRAEVLVEGGSRRPEGPAELAAWGTLRAAVEGGLRVAGACAACGHPMIADPGAARPAQAFSLPLPGGSLELGGDGALRLGGRPVSVEEAERSVVQAYPAPRPDVVADLVGSAMALVMLLPVVLWVLLVGFIAIFLQDFGSAPWAP